MKKNEYKAKNFINILLNASVRHRLTTNALDWKESDPILFVKWVSTTIKSTKVNKLTKKQRKKKRVLYKQ